MSVTNAVHELLYNHLYLDEIKLPVLIATLNLDGLLPGRRCSINWFHAVGVRCHNIRMYNRGGKPCLGHGPPAVVLAEDNGLKGPRMGQRESSTMPYYIHVYIPKRDRIIIPSSTNIYCTPRLPSTAQSAHPLFTLCPTPHLDGNVHVAPSAPVHGARSPLSHDLIQGQPLALLLRGRPS